MFRSDEPDPEQWDDVCPHCHAHYLDVCDPGCDCQTCLKSRDEEMRRRLLELDIAAGE